MGEWPSYCAIGACEQSVFHCNSNAWSISFRRSKRSSVQRCESCLDGYSELELSIYKTRFQANSLKHPSASVLCLSGQDALELQTACMLLLAAP